MQPPPVRLAQDGRVFYFRGMKRLSTVLIALLSFSACSTNPEPVSAQALAPAETPPPTIHVNASASVRRAPDVAVLHLAVETLAPTAGEASDQNATLMDRVLSAVRAQGVPASAIRTDRLDLQPRYEHRREEEPRIVGYQAINQVTVRLEDVTSVGAVVDAAIGAGANRVRGIRFELADPVAAYHEALRDAVRKARAEAEVVAAALGRRLGEPVNVSTGGFYPPPGPYRGDMAMARQEAAPAPPVEPGELEVQATVSIAWRLGS